MITRGSWLNGRMSLLNLPIRVKVCDLANFFLALSIESASKKISVI